MRQRQSNTFFIDPKLYVGYDIEPENYSLILKENPDFCFVSVLPINERFDTIIMLAVIGHLKDPIQLLIILCSMLNKDGKIIITTPNPIFDPIYKIGAKIGLFSLDAAEEHQELIDAHKMKVFAERSNLYIDHKSHFLFGANQLFVLRKTMGFRFKTALSINLL